MQNRVQLCSTDLAVELIITLQIDVYAVHQGNDLLRCLFAHVAVADEDVLQAGLVSQFCYIKGILEEDGGLGISVGDGLAAESTSLCNYSLWGNEFSRYPTGFPGQLRDVCILAVQAAKVAAYGSYGIGEAARQKMK